VLISQPTNQKFKNPLTLAHLALSSSPNTFSPQKKLRPIVSFIEATGVLLFFKDESSPYLFLTAF